MYPDIESQVAAIVRGTSDVIPISGLRNKLELSFKEGRPLIVKLGLDPTAPDIHLGFAVVLRKLRLFQDLGHRVIIIIGDYTALIGDPSGRSTTRPMLSKETILENARTYIDQLTKILSREKLDVRFNSEWLGALSFADIVSLAAKMTVAQVMQREDFANRFSNGLPISLHELLYPLAQAYDSVAIQADIEMGGQDQTFNILAGRELQREMGQDPQIALLMPILVGLDGSKKMSKSLGNYVGISESPREMFGKLMSISDAMMKEYFTLCTDVTLEQIEHFVTEAASGKQNPKDVKRHLAREIVTLYHGSDAARIADEIFETTVGSRRNADAVPDDIPYFQISSESCDSDGLIRITQLLVETQLAPSSGEAKRLIQQGGVSLDGQKVTSVNDAVNVNGRQVLRVGKHKFAGVIPSTSR